MVKALGCVQTLSRGVSLSLNFHINPQYMVQPFKYFKFSYSMLILNILPGKTLKAHRLRQPSLLAILPPQRTAPLNLTYFLLIHSKQLSFQGIPSIKKPSSLLCVIPSSNTNSFAKGGKVVRDSAGERDLALREHS